jgi:hypothetical protein
MAQPEPRLIAFPLDHLVRSPTMTSASPAPAQPIPVKFESVGSDRAAILDILNTYTKAVSTRDQALFETLLLNTSIPFSRATAAIEAGASENGARNYEAFRKGVFEGSPFTQRFQDIRIDQDGPLAAVSLVFVNTSETGSNWGWKTLQLLRIDGHWKIASEFYTSHSQGP